MLHRHAPTATAFLAVAALLISLAISPTASHASPFAALAGQIGDVLPDSGIAADPAAVDPGPGGPILVITSSDDHFGRYYSEILRNEGLNEFAVTDSATLTPATLSAYQVALLAPGAVTDAQVSMLSDWVGHGGNLIAMRPDAKLSGLLGISPTGGTLADEYLKVDTQAAPGAGITAATMQFHGTADLYALAGADAVATLYSTADEATTSPAVTLRSVGSNGGHVAAFAYDLARSVVETRQGNPAWAGQKRDGQIDPIRPDDLFYPDWVNLDKVAIPQADEQQRLLANLITDMNLARTPLPRFWYLPRGERAAVVMTGDDHGRGGTAGRFDRFIADSPSGCSVADWQCVRSTSYVFPGTPISDADVAAYQAQGFEVALHLNTNCRNFTPLSLDGNLSDQLTAFSAAFPSAAAPVTNRTHCVAWSDWASMPKAELAHGIRLDTSYYYWPGTWVQNRPGMFTGSGLPMRFADTDGTPIDVYQATTQMTDESDIDIALHIKALLDGALGPNGYYGVFTANMHTDNALSAGADAIVTEATARGVPVVSARQMLTWLDGRNSSAFTGIGYDAGRLTFTVAPGNGARGLQAMVPVDSASGRLAGLTRDGATVMTTARMVKGVDYACFDAQAGTYVATYAPDTTPPAVTAVDATPDGDGSDATATITWTTDEPADSHVAYGTSVDGLTGDSSDATMVTDHSVELTGLAPDTRYYYRVGSTDGAGNATTAPAAGQAPTTFTTPAAALMDTTVPNFAAGTADNTLVDSGAANTDGEIQLAPVMAEDFDGNGGLPTDWSAYQWPDGAPTTAPERVTRSSGTLIVDGARAGTDATYAAPRALEFEAIFSAVPFEHVGLGVDYATDWTWAMFSTGGGALPVGLYARTSSNGGSAQNTAIADVSATVPHRYRIAWAGAQVRYYIDGNLVATHDAAAGVQLRPLVSDYKLDGAKLRVRWLRLSPYTTSGTFTSRVLDAGIPAAAWQTLDAAATTPASTAVSFQTRTSDSAASEADWSDWRPVGEGGAIASPTGRYIQYRATLSSTDPTVTPTVQQVAVSYAPQATAAPTQQGDRHSARARGIER